MQGRIAGEALWRWLTAPAGRRLIALLLVGAAGLCALMIFESLALGWPVAREEPPRFDLYHMLRATLAASLAGLIVAAAVRARDADCALGRIALAPAWRLPSATGMAAALSLVAILGADPAVFHLGAGEDGAVEWASAGLLFLACAALALAAARAAAACGRLMAMLALCLAGGFFVLGMEEVSWMQRLVGFDTPDRLAEVNWQGEFNLHNLQTDLSELVYYTGAGLFLGLLPLLRDVLPPAATRHPMLDLLPTRGIAVVSAPAVVFTYGQWNLLPVQIVSWLSIFALIAFARAAAARRCAGEARLLLALALGLTIGQAALLVLGARMIDLPDASEYRELFIALGLTCWAFSIRGVLAAPGRARATQAA